jgi:hypothetical protein
MKILSLGWGVQSFTLAVMSALDDAEPLDYAIHADTLHEQKGTYDFSNRWALWLADRGVKVVTVKNPTGGLYKTIEKSLSHVPVFTLNEKGDQGQARRQCTERWKIAPIKKWLQENRNGQIVEQWLGISTDEALRMKDSQVKYIVHRWPLIEKNMSRQDCENYLSSKGIEIPPRSSCSFCPYHNTKEWQRINQQPEDWREAIKADEKLRNLRPPYRLFVHPSRKPLKDIDLRTEEQKGQISLWDDECSGICGV